MAEQIIYLDTVDPLDIYGVRNEKFETIKSFFPKLKLVARGSEIHVIGSQKECDNFERQFAKILTHTQRYHGISLQQTQDILSNLEMNESLYGNENPNNQILFYGNEGKPIKARTTNQKKMVEKCVENDLVFAIGPAGTGKTYTAVAIAVKALKDRAVQRIVLCRPAVEAEEKLGFLPGDMREKLNPYLQPLYDALQDMLQPRKLQDYLDTNVIQIAPLAYMRGRTLNNAFVILDEAQNATLNQLKMFLTRMGEHAKFIVTGDVTQIDLPDKSKSGLEKTVSLLNNTNGITAIQFNEKDIVRHRLVSHIISAFEKQSNV
ncbi:MAG: PhoH family protein [Bacteroidales bacterium]|nr:PhoH family protein [Bacteroidales bacterium]MBQ4216102.1 PhoH family protein [Bacteroidales bacterium]MBR4498558.1 PhoH family protein [Bacteroidales bacterium]MBR7036008.1 PhoH family protein [Bacteroidales bacterium]